MEDKLKCLKCKMNDAHEDFGVCEECENTLELRPEYKKELDKISKK